MGGQIFASLRAAVCVGLVLSALSFAAVPASAQFYVRSPEVDKGEAEIEEHGAFYSGPGEDERLTQTHELEGKYGLTERLEVILEGVFEQPRGEDFEAEEIELGGQYEILQREGDGVGLAFRTLYEFALRAPFRVRKLVIGNRTKPVRLIVERPGVSEVLDLTIALDS